MVRDENLKFMKNRDVYSSDYFSFVLSLASLNAVSNLDFHHDVFGMCWVERPQKLSGLQPRKLEEKAWHDFAFPAQQFITSNFSRW